ncbi:MAG: DUF268 domain-containing protein [Chloroflexi bacterium]|nr:DUF268 domain-containing protein [Chloroflexota bacterium]
MQMRSRGYRLRKMLARTFAPVYNPFHTIQWFRALPRYLRNYARYRRLSSERIELLDLYPCLTDFGDANPVAPYMLESVWAAQGILAHPPRVHVDVGSQVFFALMLATQVKTIFLDVRPCASPLENLQFTQATITALPFAADSIESLSCLSVAEHIGLGRYEDALDPLGTRRAAQQLARVLAPRGRLYFSVPLGESRVFYDAHRLHTPRQVEEMFTPLRLINFALVDERGLLQTGLAPQDAAERELATGMFLFTK